MPNKSSFKHKTKPSNLSKSRAALGTTARNNLVSEVQLEAVPLPSVLPRSFVELEALLSAQQIIHQIAASAAVESALQTQQQRHHAQIELLLEQIRLERQRRFGSSSEQLSNQGRLFDEAEVLSLLASVDDNPDGNADEALTPLAAATVDATDTATTDAANIASQTQPKSRGKRSPLPEQLERVDIVHDVLLSERTCPCGSPMVLIGQDVSEQLDIVPMQIRVLRHVRNRYGCPGSDHAPVVAKLPPQPLPKSNASPDFLAMLVTVKYVDGLPLARFEHVLARHGMPVPRQTLARWIIKLADVVQPLYNAAQDTLLSSDLIYMDETPVQVLKGTGKAATSDNYMWVRTGGPPGKPVVLFDYDVTRKAEVPVRLLADWRGYLMTDGYAGYTEVSKHEGIGHLACWAHARRYFVQARQVQPKTSQGGRGKRSHTDEAIGLIGKLYAIERALSTRTNDERYEARQSQSKPILDALGVWLQKTLPMITPQSKLGKALAYLHAHWSRLIRYTERGDLPIDNNRCENAIRPFVIGRKAWLFSDTTNGAKASAMMYSLVETAKANGLEPYTWLRHVFAKVAAAKTADDYEALMPWNVERSGPLPILG